MSTEPYQYFTVVTDDGREFTEVPALNAEAAKDRVFYWTHGRCDKKSMIVRRQS